MRKGCLHIFMSDLFTKARNGMRSHNFLYLVLHFFQFNLICDTITFKRNDPTTGVKGVYKSRIFATWRSMLHSSVFDMPND